MAAVETGLAPEERQERELHLPACVRLPGEEDQRKEPGHRPVGAITARIRLPALGAAPPVPNRTTGQLA